MRPRARRLANELDEQNVFLAGMNLVFDVAPAEEFANTAWDFAALGHPFAVSRHDLLLVSKRAST